MGHLQQLVHRILIILHVLYAVVLTARLRDLIPVVQITDHNYYGIRQRVFIEAVQQICIISPSVAEILHGCFFAFVISILYTLFFFDLHDDVIGLFLRYVILEIDLNGVVILLDRLRCRVDIDHENKENAQDQQHSCDREDGGNRHGPVSKDLQKRLLQCIKESSHSSLPPLRNRDFERNVLALCIVSKVDSTPSSASAYP